MYFNEEGIVVKKLLEVFNVLALPQTVLRHSDLLIQLTQRNISQRYRGSTLGLIWSFVQPLMMLCIYTFVFSIVFKARWGVDAPGGKGSFAVIMFCGMTLYTLFAESVGASCGSVTNNPNLVKKVIFPLEILPLSQVCASYINGLGWFVLLFLGSWLILGFVGWTMLLLPIVLFPLIVFTIGFSYLVASLGVFIRDTQYVVGVLLQMLFFATPIFYPISAVPEELRWILEINPLTIFIEQARNVFLYGVMPDWKFLGIASLISLVVMQLGAFFFYRTKRGFADVL